MLKLLKEFAVGIHAAHAIRHGIRPPAGARRDCPKPASAGERN